MRATAAVSCLLLSTAQATSAWAVGVRDVPNPRHAGAWVSDTIDVIDVETEQRLNAQLDALERERGFEVAVVTVESVDEPTPRDFATALFNHWGIGKRGLDNGVLVLLVRGSRRLEVETGYGVEATLPDGWLRNMQVAQMVPHFRAGDYGRGLAVGVAAIEQRLRAGGAPAATVGDEPVGGADAPPARTYAGTAHPARGGSEATGWFILLGVLGLAGGAGAAVKHRHDRTCPMCKTRMTMIPEEQDDAHLDRGEQTEEQIGSVDYQVFRCQTCAFGRTLRVTRWFSGYLACSSCSYKTMKRTRTVLQSPTRYSEGLAEVREYCEHCSFQNTYTRVLPRLPEPSSSSSSGGGGSSGGGFGGGSSGGGGAGSSW